jgi:hypothetical protein
MQAPMTLIQTRWHEDDLAGQHYRREFPDSPGVLVLWGENFPRYREFESGKGFHIERLR